MARTKQPVIDGKKFCVHCKETRPVNEFYTIRQRGFEYHDSKCDSCRKKYNAKYAAKWHREHRDAHNEQNRKWKFKNRERHDFLMWRSHVKRKYGLSKEEVEQLFSNQKCGICSSQDSGNSHGKRLYVDHCHKTGKVRGLLCDQCNRAIARIDAIPDWCEKATIYLSLADLAHALTPANTQRA